jgi:hypothetical protein
VVGAAVDEALGQFDVGVGGLDHAAEGEQGVASGGGAPDHDQNR